MVALAGLTTPTGLAQQSTAKDAAKTWEVLEQCRLTKPSQADGDSFHVIHRDREYVFRLYFVDAPEQDTQFREMVGDQAAYFGISTNVVPELGREAAWFTTNRLTGDFTVITRWQNARGQGALARFYAVVLVDGKNHAAELVSAGLARIHGLRANWPDGPRSARFVSELKNRELTAREQKLGAWNPERFPRDAATSSAKPHRTTPDSGQPLDLNEATYDELLRVPGIGKTLAQRIIARRPFHTVAELRKVPRIGKKAFEKLKTHFTVHVTDGEVPTAPQAKPQ